jgi:hypothetical protein
MTRKRAPVQVAVRNDDGSVRFVWADELRVQKEEHEAKVAAPPIVKGQKLSTDEILRYLAMHKRDPDFVIPVAVIDAIAGRVASKRAWARAEAEAKKSDATPLLRALRAEADKVRTEFPQFVGNDSRVAKIVIKRLDGRLTRRGKDGKRVPVKLKLGTVRRQISPTK